MTPLYFEPRDCFRVIIPARETGSGQRAVKYFKTKALAEAAIREIKRRGLNSKVSDTQHAALAMAKELGLSETEFLEAMQHFKKTVLATKNPGITVEEAAIKFLDQIQADQKNRRTLYKYRSTLRRLRDRVGGETPVVELTREAVDDYLDSFGPGTTRRSQYANVQCFLNWCLEKQYLAVSPLANAKPKDKWGSNRVPLAIDDYRRILFAVAGLEPIKPGQRPTDRYRRLLGYYVLGGLAGMRRAEMLSSFVDDPRIGWEHIDWKQNWIAVPHEVAKETAKEDRRRWIPLEPAAAEWLALVRKKSGPVVEISQSSLQRLNHELLHALKIKVPDNGLRNGFATYSATFRSKAELARAMGDLESTIDRYYIERREPESGRAWFEIRPKIGRKIISISEPAA